MLGLLKLKVPHEHDGHVRGHVVLVKEAQDVLARKRVHALLGADHRQLIRVRRIARLKQLHRGHARGAVLAALDLLLDDLKLAAKLLGLKGRVLDRVGQDV